MQSQEKGKVTWQDILQIHIGQFVDGLEVAVTKFLIDNGRRR